MTSKSETLWEEYGPIDAFLIGSGAAAQSGIDQVRHAYLLARLGLARRWQAEESANEYRGRIADLIEGAAERARLYQPLKEARPFATAAGEALPAFLMGRGTGAATLKFNVGRELVEQAAPQTIGQLLSLRAF